MRVPLPRQDEARAEFQSYRLDSCQKHLEPGKKRPWAPKRGDTEAVPGRFAWQSSNRRALNALPATWLVPTPREGITLRAPLARLSGHRRN